MECPFQDRLEFLHLDRFAKEVVGALSDRAQRVVLFGLAAGNDNLGERILRQQLGQSRQAFLRSAGRGRQAKVQNDHHRPMLPERARRARTILGQEHFIFLRQRPFHLGANLLIIIHNQQFWFHELEVRIGNSTRNVVPLPCSLSTSILP